MINCIFKKKPPKVVRRYINVNIDENILTMSFNMNELTLRDLMHLQKELKEMSKENITKVVVDLNLITYVDSSGLRFLFMVKEYFGFKITIINVSTWFADLISITNLNDFFEILVKT